MFVEAWAGVALGPTSPKETGRGKDPMKMKWIMPLCAVTVLVGCQTNRGVHEIPMARDYQDVEFFDIDEAEAMVLKAHRVGAQHHEPFNFQSATNYLKMAKASKAENDKKGTWDYSRLANDFAEKAIAEGSGFFASDRTAGAIERLDAAKDILREHGNYDWLTENGSIVILNNGIEFAATYSIMLLVLFFIGPGKASLDHLISKKFKQCN
ncbi:MAG: DUF4398 domain-containing protein [Candidatus Hydrogenedentes bacterium]|nr:DUF4398 domain-containing protein [Candidatus Hydrogenedentota bacterium]